jgi:hypothetical protein
MRMPAHCRGFCAACKCQMRTSSRAVAPGWVSPGPVEVGDSAGHDHTGQADDELVGPKQAKQVEDEGVLELGVPVVADVAVLGGSARLQDLLRLAQGWRARQVMHETVGTAGYKSTWRCQGG